MRLKALSRDPKHFAYYGNDIIALISEVLGPALSGTPQINW